MRARLTLWALRPSTPAAIADGITRAGVLTLAAGSLAAVASGAVSHVIFAGFLEVATLLGGGA